jgi:hypothetical protein
MEKMCKELRLRGGFVAEFFELESPIRQVRDQASYCQREIGIPFRNSISNGAYREVEYMEMQFFPSLIWISELSIINTTPSTGKKTATLYGNQELEGLES